MWIFLIVTFCSFSSGKVVKPEGKDIIDDLINIAGTAFDGVFEGIGYIVGELSDFVQSDDSFVELTGILDLILDH